MKWFRFFKRKREEEEEDTRIYTVDTPNPTRPQRARGAQRA